MNFLCKYEDNFHITRIVEIDIDDIIGRGNTIVYRGVLKDSTNKEICEVAIKQIILKEYKIINEIKIMQNINHENLIKLYCSDKTKCKNDLIRYSIVMEYCKGGDLFEFIKKNPILPEHQIKNYFKQIVQGLNHLHSQSIIHRDIKPQNILLTNDNKTVKIADYDISKYLNVSIQSHTLEKGTYGYMAPEVLEKHMNSNDRNYDFSADIFSLGVTVFYMFYKRQPWMEFNDIQENLICGNLSQIYKEKLQKKYELFNNEQEVSFEAKTLILKMLAFNADERITLKEIMEDPYFKENEILERFNFEGKKIIFIQKLLEKIYNLDEFCSNKVVWINSIYYILKYIKFTVFALNETIKGKYFYWFGKKKWQEFYSNKLCDNLSLKLNNLYENSSKNLESFLNEINTELLDKSNSFIIGMNKSLMNLLKEYKIILEKGGNDDLVVMAYEIMILFEFKDITIDGKFRNMNLESFDKEINTAMKKNRGLVLERIYFFFKKNKIE